MRTFSGIAQPFVFAALILTVHAAGDATAIARGQTPPVKHPVLAHAIDPQSGPGLERALRPLMGLDEPPYVKRRLPDGSTFQGRLAVLRRRAGQVTAAWVIDGLALAAGDLVLKPKAPRYEGPIESATRVADGATANTLVTTADLPEAAALAGQWMIVTHGNGRTHGYAIHHVERKGPHTSIFLNDDHGLRITGHETEECYFPRRTIRGPNRFVIVGASRFPSD